jgi:hypothetical protein
MYNVTNFDDVSLTKPFILLGRFQELKARVHGIRSIHLPGIRYLRQFELHPNDE